MSIKGLGVSDRVTPEYPSTPALIDPSIRHIIAVQHFFRERMATAPPFPISPACSPSGFRIDVFEVKQKTAMILFSATFENEVGKFAGHRLRQRQSQ